jgi:hypothetical protein
MKMSIIASLWRYDSIAYNTLQLASLRCPAASPVTSGAKAIVGQA